ncbi:LysR family transcriptional regulator [Verticiella sediminum]|uniref:LysR family transcriptional regulator n=1 Tax=Verticiella sediminum TaxID=1247510 RepID=A0A556AYV0_9BURK|nr:LysR family transcriptional regulator [Verticiella sediminum]TSH98120.1 LysR family transcriptional regulator [Verticiella sediminum]
MVKGEIVDEGVPRLDDIALFVEVARRKSVSRGAEALGLPTSTVSRRLKQLERMLGLRLLNRTTRRMELTEAGARYYARCLPLVEEVRVAHEQLGEMLTVPRGHLRVSMPNSLGSLILPRLLSGFSEAFPDILCEVDLGVQSVDAVTNPFDVVLRFGVQPDSGLVARRILLMEHGLFAAKSYLDRHGRPREPEDLRAHHCLRPYDDASSSRWSLRRGDEVREVEVRGRVVVNNIGMLGTLARLGLGITSQPFSKDLHFLAAGEDMEQVLADWSLDPIPLYALLPSRILPAKTRAFLDYLAPLLVHDATGSG